MMFSFQKFWFFWSGHTFWVYKIQPLWSHTSQKSGRLWVLSPCLLLLPKSLRYKPDLLVFSQSLIILLFSTPHYYEQLNHSSHVIFLTSGRYYTSLFPLQPNSILNLGKKTPPPTGLRSVRGGCLDMQVNVSEGSDLAWLSPGHGDWSHHLASMHLGPPLRNVSSPL